MTFGDMRSPGTQPFPCQGAVDVESGAEPIGISSDSAEALSEDPRITAIYNRLYQLPHDDGAAI